MKVPRYTGWLLICAASLAWGFEPKASPFTPPVKGGQSAATTGTVPRAPTPGASHEPMVLGTRALRGILLNGENSWANVEGDLVRKGELLEGWRLDRLEPVSAHFSRHGKKQRLELQRPQVMAPTAKTGTDPEPGASAGNATAAVVPATTPPGSGVLPQELLQKMMGTK